MASVQGTAPLTSMPIMAGEDMRLHDAVQFWESVQTALAHVGLLKSAMGLVPDEADQIVDLDLSSLPVLPPEHPQYYRQLETMLKVKAQNKSNRKKRYAIIMKQRTAVYTMMHKSAETKAPIFARELREACDYSRAGTVGGYFDGVTAYRMMYARLFAEERTQMDTDFYNTAKDLQTKSRLPDGCTADEFMAKAVSWIYKIRPRI